MGRPKGSKHKPKSTAKIPVENASDSVENHSESVSETVDGTPNIFQLTANSHAEQEFEQDLTSNNTEQHSENSQRLDQNYEQLDQSNESRDDISESSTATSEINRIGNFKFKENDNLSPTFCKVAMIPNLMIRMTSKIKNAIKKALGKLCNKYIQQPNDANIFNILTFWKLIKTRHSERERDMLDNIKNLGDGQALEMLKRIVDNMQSMEVMPQSDESAVNEQHDFLSNNEIKRIVSLTEKGHLSKAAKLIEKETKGIADINKTTVHEMIKLNPHGAANPFGNWNEEIL